MNYAQFIETDHAIASGHDGGAVEKRRGDGFYTKVLKDTVGK